MQDEHEHTDEAERLARQDEDVEAHHFKTGPSTEDPGMRGHSDEEDDDVEAHHFKTSPTEKLIGGDERAS